MFPYRQQLHRQIIHTRARHVFFFKQYDLYLCTYGNCSERVLCGISVYPLASQTSIIERVREQMGLKRVEEFSSEGGTSSADHSEGTFVLVLIPLIGSGSALGLLKARRSRCRHVISLTNNAETSQQPVNNVHRRVTAETQMNQTHVCFAALLDT